MKGKILFLIISVLFLSAICFAQNATGNIQDSATIVAVSFETRYTDLKLQSADSKTPYIQTYKPDSNGLPASRDAVQYQKSLETVKLNGDRQGVINLKVKNNTAKKIDSIVYSFQVIDKGSGQSIKKYTIINETKIKPGRTAGIRDAIAPDFNNTAVKYEAQIIRINFADGTFLER